MKSLGIEAVVVGLVFLTARAEAQSYAINRFTLDGGGGASAGGQYTLSGTIGHPNAGAMSGGSFTLEGGFWPGLVLPLPGGPTLFIQLAGSQVSISWSPATPDFELESTDDLALPAWSPVAGSSPVTIPMTGPARFYRLKKP